MWLVLYSLIVIMDLKYFNDGIGFLNDLHRMGFLVGSMWVLGFASFFPQRIKKIDLPSIAMFIFLSHSMLRSIPFAISNKYLYVYPSIAFIFNIVLTLALCIALYFLLRKLLSEKLFGLLTGGR